MLFVYVRRGATPSSLSSYETSKHIVLIFTANCDRSLRILSTTYFVFSSGKRHAHRHTHRCARACGALIVLVNILSIVMMFFSFSFSFLPKIPLNYLLIRRRRRCHRTKSRRETRKHHRNRIYQTKTSVTDMRFGDSRALLGKQLRHKVLLRTDEYETGTKTRFAEI